MLKFGADIEVAVFVGEEELVVIKELLLLVAGTEEVPLHLGGVPLAAAVKAKVEPQQAEQQQEVALAEQVDWNWPETLCLICQGHFLDYSSMLDHPEKSGRESHQCTFFSGKY